MKRVWKEGDLYPRSWWRRLRNLPSERERGELWAAWWMTSHTTDAEAIKAVVSYQNNVLYDPTDFDHGFYSVAGDYMDKVEHRVLNGIPRPQRGPEVPIPSGLDDVPILTLTRD